MECIRLHAEVNPREICYIRNTLESYDGMALVRTLDPSAALLEIHVPPRCKEVIISIIESLRQEGVSIFLTRGANC